MIWDHTHYIGNWAIDLKSGKTAGKNETGPENLQKCRLRAGGALTFPRERQNAADVADQDCKMQI